MCTVTIQVGSKTTAQLPVFIITYLKGPLEFYWSRNLIVKSNWAIHRECKWKIKLKNCNTYVYAERKKLKELSGEIAVLKSHHHHQNTPVSARSHWLRALNGCRSADVFLACPSTEGRSLAGFCQTDCCSWVECQPVSGEPAGAGWYSVHVYQALGPFHTDALKKVQD